MIKPIFFSLILFLFSFHLAGQNDNVSSGRAIFFDGVDDYIDLGNIYKDVQLPITIAAWIFVTPGAPVTLPIIHSRDDASTVVGNGFYLEVFTTPSIGVTYSDGMGGNNPAYRRSKTGVFQSLENRWVYVTAVMRSALDMDVYLNGYNLGGVYVGTSNSPMFSNNPNGIAKIGFVSFNFQTAWFHGVMDEIRIWNRSLSQDEVRSTMCVALKGNEPGLIGYWDFNETSGNIAYDKSPNGYNGQLMGSPTRVFSGAPIGDRSVYTYLASWAGSTFTIKDGTDSLVVNNITGDPQGIHLYEVSSVPTQTGGLDLTKANHPYFGVYLASSDVGNTFDIVACIANKRDDNSMPNWSKVIAPSNSQRGEFIDINTSSVPVDLGADKVVCDETSTTLSTGFNDPGFSYLWSTGETTSSIVVHNSGQYKVVVTEPCNMAADSIGVNFIKNPVFTLGNDSVYCPFTPKLLKPLNDTTGLKFLWQDGSSKPTLEAKDFGVYWVTVSNLCGSLTDTLKFSKFFAKISFVPNVITPNGDNQNEFFKVQDDLVGSVELMIFNRWGAEVYRSDNYQNDWNGRSLPDGIYFIRLTGSCIHEYKSPLSIIR